MSTLLLAAALWITAPLLSPPATVERELAGGEAHLFRVEVAPGRPLLVTVEQQGIDVVVGATAPDGTLLPPLDSPNGRHGPEYLVLSPDPPGEYRIEVRSPARFVAAGRYLLRVEELPEGEARAAFSRMTEAARLYRQATADSRRSAIGQLEAALAVWRNLGRMREEAETLFLLAAAHRALGEPRPALDLYRAALALRLSLADDAGQANALLGAGLVQWELGDNPAALESLGRALSLFDTAGDRSSAAAARNNLCLIRLSAGDLVAARSCFEQVLAEVGALGDRGREAAALNSLGGVWDGLGEPLRARDHYEKALALHREAQDLRGESQALNNLAGIEAGLGETERALDLYAQALALFQRLGDRLRESSVLNNLGWMYLSLGEPERARPHLEQALDLRRRLGDRRGEAVSLTNLGLALARLGDLREAAGLHRQALRIAAEAGDRSTECAALELLSRVQIEQGDFAAALETLGTALALARDLGDRGREALILQRLGRAQDETGQGEAALASLAQALELNRAVHDPVHQVEALQELARLELRRGLDASAWDRIEEAMALLETLRPRVPDPDLRASFFAARQGVYELAVELRMRRGSAREAFEVSERARARSLLDLLGEAGTPLGAAAIQAHLDADTLLLEISLGEARSHLWRVSADSISGFELPGRAAIEALAEDLYRRLRSPGAGEAGPAAAELARLVLGPMAGRLGGRRLVIVADGLLQLIPFAVLPDPASPGEPLLVRHEIVSLPSASVLAVQRQELAGRPPAPRTLAVLADPVFDARDSRLARPSPPDAGGDPAAGAGERGSGPGGFLRLPATRREAQAIAALVPPGEFLTALDFRASRATAEAPELALYRIVHFATHGVLDARRPERSGLVLSLVDETGKPQEGFLGLGDIHKLRLGADLVVLSGCETALGKQVRGEGLIGLSHGFFQAGARRIVASLWRVQDRSTAELMTRFYRGLLVDGLPPAAALRQAQLAVRNDPQWREPYHWAPFILQGDWR